MTLGCRYHLPDAGDCLLRIISQEKLFTYQLVIKNIKNKVKVVSNKFQTKVVYCKYPNLMHTQVEIISDPNYLVHILFER